MAHDLLDAPDDSFDLEVTPAPEPVKTEGALAQVPAPSPEELLRLSGNASSWVAKVAALPPQSLEFKQEVDAIFEVGSDAFRETASTSSRFLEQSLATSKSGGAQEQVSRSLVDLRNEVDELAPGEDTFAERLLGALPFANRVKRYFKRYCARTTPPSTWSAAASGATWAPSSAPTSCSRASTASSWRASTGSVRRETPSWRHRSRETPCSRCASVARTCRRRLP